MNNRFELFKKYRLIGLTVVLLLGGVIKVALWADDVERKISQIEQVQMKMAQVAEKQAHLEDKLFEFVMNLWKIDPEERSKWKVFPQTMPRDSSERPVFNSPWVEFEGFDRLIKYVLVVDTLGNPRILVDTLYECRRDSL